VPFPHTQRSRPYDPPGLVDMEAGYGTSPATRARVAAMAAGESPKAASPSPTVRSAWGEEGTSPTVGLPSRASRSGSRTLGAAVGRSESPKAPPASPAAAAGLRRGTLFLPGFDGLSTRQYLVARRVLCGVQVAVVALLSASLGLATRGNVFDNAVWGPVMFGASSRCVRVPATAGARPESVNTCCCSHTRCTTPHHTTPHHTTPHHTTLHRTALHRTAPHHTTPHRTAPYHTTPSHGGTSTNPCGVLCRTAKCGVQHANMWLRMQRALCVCRVWICCVCAACARTCAATCGAAPCFGRPVGADHLGPAAGLCIAAIGFTVLSLGLTALAAAKDWCLWDRRASSYPVVQANPAGTVARTNNVGSPVFTRTSILAL
jgi:hypothetical protein